jgi:hypothetical protein
MRNNPANQIAGIPDFELEGSVGSIGSNGTASPRALKHVEELRSFRVLADRKTRSNLPAEAVSHARLKRNAETAFAIHIARDVGVEIRSGIQGRRLMRSIDLIQGSHP